MAFLRPLHYLKAWMHWLMAPVQLAHIGTQTRQQHQQPSYVWTVVLGVIIVIIILHVFRRRVLWQGNREHQGQTGQMWESVRSHNLATTQVHAKMRAKKTLLLAAVLPHIHVHGVLQNSSNSSSSSKKCEVEQEFQLFQTLKRVLQNLAINYNIYIIIQLNEQSALADTGSESSTTAQTCMASNADKSEVVETSSDLHLNLNVPPEIEEEKKWKEYLLHSLDLESCGLKSHRILFYTTAKGKHSLARHIEPDIFVDSDLEETKRLAPFLSEVLHVSSVCSLRIEDDRLVSSSVST